MCFPQLAIQCYVMYKCFHHRADRTLMRGLYYHAICIWGIYGVALVGEAYPLISLLMLYLITRATLVHLDRLSDA